MINSLMTFACDVCNDYGILFLGDNNDFNVEPCDCIDSTELNNN